MENNFYPEFEGIYRLRVPFHNIYTSVFLIISKDRRILLDCATTAGDVDGVILPALERMEISPQNLDEVTFAPADVGNEERKLAIECSKKSIGQPFKVT